MISVLMSVYNEKVEWVRQSVQSILNQTYTDFEFIILIDNPNLDQDLDRYLVQTSKEDLRVKLLYNEKNMGLAASLNRGLEIAQGTYIARMDADDISEPNRLEAELDYLIEQSLDLVSANKINIDEDGNVLFADDSLDRDPNLTLPYSNIIVHPLVLVKTEVMRSLGGYRFFVNSEDYDLWLRMVDSGYRLGILNEYLLKYRLRPSSASIGRQLEQYYVMRYILKLHKERIQGVGTDSFSVESQNKYLEKKRITEVKKTRFAKSNVHIKAALDSMNSGKYFACAHQLFCAFFLYPELSVVKIRNNIKQKML